MQLTNLREEQATAAKAREGAVRLSAHASHSHPSAHHTPDPYPSPFASPSWLLRSDED